MSDQKYTPEQIEEAFNDVARICMIAVLNLLKLKGQGELNFMRKTIHTPEGGTYMLQVCHVDGPKIDCQNLKEWDGEEKDQNKG